jgi:hypothetical protein
VSAGPRRDASARRKREARVITLERLIEIKRHLTRPKDKLMLMQLEAALEERRKAESGTG